MIRFLVAMLAVVSLAGCNIPRGAALQKEVLATQEQEAGEFAVHKVNRAFLPIVANWPRTGNGASRGWLTHHHGPDQSVIKPYDSVKIIVWDSEEQSLLSNEAERMVNIEGQMVSPGGMIFLPYVGEVHVAGKTPTAARRFIQEKMTEIVPSAQVQLAVTPGARGSVTVVSGVATPGDYAIVPPHFTVLNAISSAGGPAVTNENPQLRLVRSGRVFTISLSRLYEEPALDTVLLGGDKLIVEKDPRYFRSLGAASKEQIIAFDREEISALDAMSMIGGLTDNRADPKGILILREYPPNAVKPGTDAPDNSRTIFVIDLTSADGLFSAGQFRINSQDTVLVTESPVNSANVVLGLINRILGVANPTYAILGSVLD